jgi:hypothetical protein
LDCVGWFGPTNASQLVSAKTRLARHRGNGADHGRQKGAADVATVDRRSANSLNPDERRLLERCDEVIRIGRRFLDVGGALMTVRRRTLYRQDYTTFEEYCDREHGINGSRARQVVIAYESVTAVTTSGGEPAPENERQARALAPLRRDPALATEAWSMAVSGSGGGQPSADRVAGAVARVQMKTTARHPRSEVDASDYVWMGWTRELGRCLRELDELLTYADDFARDLADFDGIVAGNAAQTGAGIVTVFAMEVQARIANAGIGVEIHEFIDGHRDAEGNRYVLGEPPKTM